MKVINVVLDTVGTAVPITVDSDSLLVGYCDFPGYSGYSLITTSPDVTIEQHGNPWEELIIFGNAEHRQLNIPLRAGLTLYAYLMQGTSALFSQLFLEPFPVENR